MRKFVGGLICELKKGVSKEEFLSSHDIRCVMIFTPEQGEKSAIVELFPVKQETEYEVISHNENHALVINETEEECEELIPPEILEQLQMQEMMEALQKMFRRM